MYTYKQRIFIQLCKTYALCKVLCLFGCRCISNDRSSGAKVLWTGFAEATAAFEDAAEMVFIEGMKVGEMTGNHERESLSKLPKRMVGEGKNERFR